MQEVKAVATEKHEFKNWNQPLLKAILEYLDYQGFNGKVLKADFSMQSQSVVQDENFW